MKVWMGFWERICSAREERVSDCGKERRRKTNGIFEHLDLNLRHRHLIHDHHKELAGFEHWERKALIEVIPKPID